MTKKTPAKKSTSSKKLKFSPIYPGSVRVAAVQMNSTPDIDHNLRHARELLDEALKHNPNVVAFPENMLHLSNDARACIEAGQHPTKGHLIEILREWAAEADIWLLAGSLPLKAPGGKIFNSSVLFSPEGEIHSRYDKIHLFDVVVQGDQAYLESKTVAPGKKVVTADTAWGKFGLSICYDLRFPELYRQHADRGAHAIFIPAAFTATTGKAHWDVLTRARAIENQCYVVAPGQCGFPHPGRETHGHTRIIDPWGRVIAERTQGPGVVWADLDYSLMEKIRQDLPSLHNRRLS